MRDIAISYRPNLRDELHAAYTTETLRSFLKSRHYTCFWETKRAFVLSYGPGVPTVIPKSAFTGETDLADARALLAATFGGTER